MPSATTADSVSLVQHTRNGSHASDVVKASSSILTVPSGGHTKAASIDCVGHTRTPSAGSAKVFLSLRKVSWCPTFYRGRLYPSYSFVWEMLITDLKQTV